MSYDPTQPGPPPIDPTQFEPLPAPSPESPSAFEPAAPAAFAETQIAAPPPPPEDYASQYSSPSAAAPAFSLSRDWPTVVLALMYVVGVIFGFIGAELSPSSSVGSHSSAFGSIATTISGVLVFIALIGVLVLDWRGYFSLRGWVQRRHAESERLILGCILVFFCIIFLPIYFIRRFMGKPQETPYAPMSPMPPAMLVPNQFSGPYSGPMGGPAYGPPPYMSGPMSAPPPPAYSPYPPAPVYMNPPMPQAPQPIIVVQGAQPQQLIKTYKGGWHAAQRNFQHDANHLARQGWRVQQVITTQTGAAGVYGHGLGIGRSKVKELTVIYTR